jgi:hypothetical protein
MCEGWNLTEVGWIKFLGHVSFKSGKAIFRFKKTNNLLPADRTECRTVT